MMKLLFDQNISFRLIKRIVDLFPQSKQVRELGLENFIDIEIFEFAKKHDNNSATKTYYHRLGVIS
ncbi:MAG: DUF5615 family PIN-like protein [Bacteroidota bacterium]|nr:DUF5615 family PIN-like protein [Bacteroidota bacterium]